MIEQLQKMAADTLAALQERNALPEKANSAEVRYAADYIVKKSPLQPFFAELGITKGSQIGRSFDCSRNIIFFGTVVKLYYIKWYYGTDLPAFNNVQELFKHPDWQEVTYKVTNQFKELLRTLRIDTYLSMGVGKEAEYRHSIFKQEATRLLKFTGTPEAFLEAASFAGSFKDAVALAIYTKNWQRFAVVQKWLEENSDDIADLYMRYGLSRSILSHLHGFKLTPQSGVQKVPTQQELAKDASCIAGYSHADLNEMAQAWQELCLHRLDLIENCQPQETMSDNIFTTGSLTSASIPQEVTQLADRLAQKHGPVTITSEASGIHIYIPDPELLQEDGRKELTSKHLAINAEKYLGIGKYNVDQYPTKENKQLYAKFYSKDVEVPCAISMKTKKRYSVDALLRMPPIEKRIEGIGDIRRTVTTSDPDKHLVQDEFGNWVPRWPGACVPLRHLPEDHVAREYLEKMRKFDIEDLSNTWGLCYCKEAEAEDRALGIYYSRLPYGCRNSPQGRIIIPIYDDEGVRRGWQARIIDFTNVHDDQFVWTDKQEWLLTKHSGNDPAISDEFPKGFAPHKYLNAKGSQRNALLFGLLQAVKFNADKPFNQRYCVLVEGPFDAMRGGAPCIALLGKSMSYEQAAMIRKNFAVVYTVMDQDTAGKECLKRIQQMLPDMNIHELQVPTGYKDLGDCTYEEAKAILPQC